MALPVTDLFNGAAGPLSNPPYTQQDYGLPSVTVNLDGSGGAVVSSSGEDAAVFRNDEVFDNDQYSEIIIGGAGMGAGVFLGPTVRSQDTSDATRDFYEFRTDGTSGTLHSSIMLRTNSVLTELLAINMTCAPGDTLGIRAVGNVITAYLNGTDVGSVTDSTLTSGSAGFHTGYGASSGVFVASWTAGNAVKTAAISGSATTGIDEAALIATDKTIVISLTNETFKVLSALDDITIVGTPQAAGTLNGADTTLTFDVAPQQGDVVVVWGGGFNRTAAGYPGPSTAGYTQIFHTTAALPFMDVSYKRMGATPDSSVTCKGTGNTSDGTSYGCIVLRGVDPTTLLDVAVVDAGPTASTNPDPPAITTVTNKAMVLALALSTSNDAAHTAPTGYSNNIGAGANDTNDSSVGGATKIVTTAGSENPGAFTAWTTGTWRGVTIAIRPRTLTPFADAAQDLIDGAVSGGSETHGWNNEVLPNIPTSNVSRDSDTQVTITIPHAAIGAYNITAPETITETVPASILSGGNDIVGTPTFVISPAGGSPAASGSGFIRGSGRIIALGFKSAMNLAAISGRGRDISTGLKGGSSIVIISGSGRDIASGIKAGQGAGLIRASGRDLSGIGIKAASNSGTLAGGGRIFVVASGQPIIGWFGVVSGSGAMVASGTKNANNIGLVRGTGVVQDFGLKGAAGIARLSGSGRDIALGLKGGTGHGSLSGSGTERAAIGIKAGFGAGLIADATFIVSSGVKGAFGSGSVSGFGRVVATNLVIVGNFGRLSGSGRMTAAGIKNALAGAMIRASGRDAGAGFKSGAGSAILRGGGRILETGRKAASGIAVVGGGGGTLFVVGGKNVIGQATHIAGGGLIRSFGSSFVMPTEFTLDLLRDIVDLTVDVPIYALDTDSSIYIVNTDSFIRDLLMDAIINEVE